MHTWHIITGEYPPQVGGISHYTEQLAEGLRAQGCEVHVWCPCTDEGPKVESGVEVHRIRGLFSLRRLREFGHSLDRFRRPRTILLQYTPNALGMRGLNLFFCVWLLWRGVLKKDDVRVMFHEPFFYFARQSLRRNLLALVHRLMAVVLMAASKVVYVSIPAWIPMLSRYCWFRRPQMIWLPIPATIPHVEDKRAVAKVRDALTVQGRTSFVVGHFGTYGDHITGDLSEILKRLLQERSDLIAVCLGSRGEQFIAQLIESNALLKGRIVAPGVLSPQEISLYLQACDLVIQPYPDGASSRRTSLMAAISNGVPTLTTYGKLSEKIWKESAAVRLAPAHDIDAAVSLAIELLSEAEVRRIVGEKGRDFYLDNFSLSRTLLALQQGAGPVSEMAAVFQH